MERKITPHTTVTILPGKVPFAKRSATGGNQFSSRGFNPSPQRVSFATPAGGPLRNAGPLGPRFVRPLSQSMPISELETMYVVSIQADQLRIYLPPGKEFDHTPDKGRTLVNILKQRGLYDSSRMKAVVMRGYDTEVYDRLVVGGSPFTWVHPVTSKKTTFVIRRSRKLEQPETSVSVPSSSGSRNNQVSSATAVRKSVNNGLSNNTHAAQVKQALLKSFGTTVEQVKKRGRPRKEVQSSNSKTEARGSNNFTKKPVIVIDLSESDEEEDLGKPKSAKRDYAAPPQKEKGATTIEKKTDSSETSPISVVCGEYNNLPSKTIIPPSKSVSCLYRIPVVKTFFAKFSKGLTFNPHPFLGEAVQVASSPFFRKKERLKKPQPVAAKATTSTTTMNTRKRKLTGSDSNSEVTAPQPVNKKKCVPVPKEIAINKQVTLRSSRRGDEKTKEIVPKNKPEQLSSKGRPLRRVLKELSISSSDNSDCEDPSSDSSSSSSSSGDSDSENDGKEKDDENEYASSDEEVTRPGSNKGGGGEPIHKKKSDKKSVIDKQLLKDIFKPPPRYFIEATPSRPIRKSPEGQIYFSLKAKLTPNQYYQNEDLFTNWEKFVRNESEVSQYYKTMLVKTNLSNFLIYHMEKRNDKIEVDRDVEMKSDGTITISLGGEDVTQIFMQYTSIETNSHLNALLLNLCNSNLCPGCPNYSTVSVVPTVPSAFVKDDIWFSSKCSRVVFNSPLMFITQPSHNFYPRFGSNERTCPACTELKKKLESEKQEILKVNQNQRLKFKNVETATKQVKPRRGRNAKAAQLVYGSYKPPEVEKGMQVRKALSDLFLDFWKEMGLKEDDYPEQTTKFDCTVVSEKDLLKEPDDNPVNPVIIPGLPPPLPTSIPILENIEFDENGQTKLTFSEIPLNPYEMQQNTIAILNPHEGSSSTVPEFSTDLINSIANSSNSQELLEALSNIPDPARDLQQQESNNFVNMDNIGSMIPQSQSSFNSEGHETNLSLGNLIPSPSTNSFSNTFHSSPMRNVSCSSSVQANTFLTHTGLTPITSAQSENAFTQQSEFHSDYLCQGYAGNFNNTNLNSYHHSYTNVSSSNGSFGFLDSSNYDNLDFDFDFGTSTNNNESNNNNSSSSSSLIFPTFSLKEL